MLVEVGGKGGRKMREREKERRKWKIPLHLPRTEKDIRFAVTRPFFFFFYYYRGLRHDEHVGRAGQLEKILVYKNVAEG